MCWAQPCSCHYQAYAGIGDYEFAAANHPISPTWAHLESLYRWEAKTKHWAGDIGGPSARQPAARCRPPSACNGRDAGKTEAEVCGP